MFRSDTFEALIDKFFDEFGDLCNAEYQDGLMQDDGQPIFKTDSPESVSLTCCANDYEAVKLMC